VIDDSAQHWENRYRQTSHLFGDRPSELLVQHRHLFQPGMNVLAIGDGEGRNGIWLAEQGLKVCSVDVSATALNRARRAAEQRGVRLATKCVDVRHWKWPKAKYDMVCSIYVHFPASDKHYMLRRMFAALKPGGCLVLEAFHKQQATLASGGPNDPDMLYSCGELRRIFARARIIRLEKAATRVVMEGADHGPGSAVYLVVCKR
jgi:2-polyprenyl-3-methyl-5-hydroxy-6-metoxy-1,4-benzoquinol methylase